MANAPAYSVSQADFSPEPPGDPLAAPAQAALDLSAPEAVSAVEDKPWKPSVGGDDAPAVVSPSWASSPSNGSTGVYGLIGPPGRSGSAADLALARPADAASVRFFNTGGRGGDAYNVIYVIDNSGSVIDAFDGILQEVKTSLTRLNERQRFHVLFFSLVQAPQKRLVTADEQNKREAVTFLNGVRAEGITSPLGALEAAFKVFKACPDQRGKVLYFLSDGDFDTQREPCQYKGRDGRSYSDHDAVIAWLRDHNKDKSVHVYPLILDDRPPPTAEPAARARWERIESCMQTLARENGGEYKCIPRK